MARNGGTAEKGAGRSGGRQGAVTPRETKMTQAHLAGLEQALAKLPADVGASLIVKPGAVHRC